MLLLLIFAIHFCTCPPLPHNLTSSTHCNTSSSQLHTFTCDTNMSHTRLESDASTVPTTPDTEPKPQGLFDHIEHVNTASTANTGPAGHPKVELGGVEQLDEINGYEYTAYNFSTGKKWWILTVVALCQTSMNFVYFRPLVKFLARLLTLVERGDIFECGEPAQRALRDYASS